MFVLQSTPEIWWPVKVNVPADDGTIKKATFKARFRILKADEIDAITADVQTQIAQSIKDRDDGDVLPSLPDVHDKIIAASVTDWGDIKTETGEDLSFSADTLTRIMQYPYIKIALVEAYQGMARGAKPGN